MTLVFFSMGHNVLSNADRIGRTNCLKQNYDFLFSDKTTSCQHIFAQKIYFKSWSNSVITNFKEQFVFNYESDFELTSDIRE